MTLTKRNIFLLDSLGAFASLFLSGLMLPMFLESIGLSLGTLYFLAALAGLFMLYSGACYLYVKEIKAWMLKLIISANFIYCLIAVGLIIFYENLTRIGVALLGLEIVVIFLVIGIEVKTLKLFQADKR